LRFVPYHACQSNPSLLNGGREMCLRAPARAHKALVYRLGKLFVGGSIRAKHGSSLSGRCHRRTANDGRQGNRPYGRRLVSEGRSPRQPDCTPKGRAEQCETSIVAARIGTSTGSRRGDISSVARRGDGGTGWRGTGDRQTLRLVSHSNSVTRDAPCCSAPTPMPVRVFTTAFTVRPCEAGSPSPDPIVRSRFSRYNLCSCIFSMFVQPVASNAKEMPRWRRCE
jgi:hypothetical protein